MFTKKNDFRLVWKLIFKATMIQIYGPKDQLRPVQIGFSSVLTNFKLWWTKDRTAATVFVGPDNFRSWSVTVRSSWPDIQTLDEKDLGQ